MLITDIGVILFFCAQVVFVLSSFIFAVSAIDDLVIDVYFYLYLSLKSFCCPEKERSIGSKWNDVPEKHIAIMLPAWQEGDVIVKSVINLMNTMAYKNYHVFIGTYPNDPQTQREVDRLTIKFESVHKVVTPLAGPTCKADCLNSIVKAILDCERQASFTFSGFVLQDAEDIVHPMSLRIFNYYLTQYDLIQIPVYSLKRKWHQLTGGHYMDEFAEFQGKEVRVREQLAKLVPGAGVGTAYSRRAIMAFGASGDVFNTNSLTEDYEFSLRLHAAGFRQVFARIAEPSEFGWENRYDRNAPRSQGAAGYIATREYFPNKFWASVRQKTRWTIGISLQGWKNFRWRGGWRIRYFLWRDRKMLFFSQAIAAGFFSLAIFGLFNVYYWLKIDGYQPAPLLSEDSLVWYVVRFNILVLILRILQRFYWSCSLYGPACLPLLPLRYMWGALINYLAITRAIKIYLFHLISGEIIGWDKTAHDFPESIHDNITGLSTILCRL